jgi:hypothetical protein
MDANAIRDFVVKEADPPVQGKGTTLDSDLSLEISKLVPFWAPLLRDRDIRDGEGGDAYVTGLIEAFSRIYRVLKEKGVHRILNTLELETLYSLDAELAKSDLGLADEYPALEMADVKSQGSFGAGVLMAYALFETAVAVTNGPVDAKYTKGITPSTAPQKSQEAEVQSLADDLLAGLPEEETSIPQPEPTPVAQPPGKKLAGMWTRWDFQQEPATQGPLMLLGIYPSENGLMVRGELPPTLSGASQAYNIVKAIFGVDANIHMGQKGLEFSFSFMTKGKQP